MLESLRSFLSGKTLLIFVTIMAIPFVFLGSSAVGTIFTTYGKVNGLEVTQTDLNAANNTVNQRLLEVYGEEFSLDIIPEDTLLGMVKEEIISQKTLLSETIDLGIDVSEDQAKKQIMQSPSFQTGAQFDQIAFETAVRTQGYTPNGYIAVVQEGMAKNYLIDAIASSFFTLESEIQNTARLIEQERDISFTKIDFSMLKESIQSDLVEAQSYYDQNNIKFYSDESRSMNYIFVANDSYKDKVDVPENYVEEAYEDYVKRLEMRSEKRASHIMIDLINYDSKTEALDKISKAQEALNTGTEFIEVVQEYSEDFVSKELEGDIGFSSGDVFPEEFEDALINMAEGDVSEIIFSKATNSYHILKLTEINKENPSSLDDMKDSLLNELITAESEALMDEDRDFIDNAILSNSTLTDIASSLDREIKTTDNMSVSNFNFDLKDPQIVQTLFSIPDGFNSPEVIEIEEGMLVLSLNTVKASELMPFEQVAEDALDYVKDEKATEAILALQNSIQSDENPDTTKSFITVDNFVGVKRFSSLLPAEVLQEAFLTAANQKFQITAANGDSYIMSIDGVKSPDDEFLDAMIEEYKEFDRNQVSNKMASLIFAQMRNSAKVNLQNL
jgi:peptidyl-prolyl cis-trans isomerase D